MTGTEISAWLTQATQEVVSRLPQTTEREFNDAVQAAKDAYPKWRNTALPTRSRVMFKFQELIRQDMVGLAEGPSSLIESDMHSATAHLHCVARCALADYVAEISAQLDA